MPYAEFGAVASCGVHTDTPVSFLAAAEDVEAAARESGKRTDV
jgi:hypothetical protein